jgi:hypothetical protein
MQDKAHHTKLDCCVIKALLYFDIFNYPLKSEEVFKFLGMNSVTENDVSNSLASLARENYLFHFMDLYSIQKNEALMQRRLNGNALAEKYLPLAQRKALFIGKFPFIRGVFASGSLSKNYMDDKSDLDFFIITAPGRLWIARTLLVMYKRLFLGNSHKYFCVNYFIDEAHLEIEEKNQFTATELATLIPLYNSGLYYELISANGWVKQYFPNMKLRKPDISIDKKITFMKRLSESLLNISGIEKLFMKVTLLRWKRIYQHKYSPAEFEVAFKTKDYASKNHPNQYQRKVIERYEQKVSEFSNKHNIILQP